MTHTRDFALALGLIALAVGMWLHPFEWDLLAPRLQDSLVVAAAVAAVAASLARLFRIRMAVVVLAICLPAIALAFVGLAGLVATLVLVLAGAAVGTLLPVVPGTSPLLRLIAGLGLLAGVAGWLLPFPVHHAATWGLACAGLVVWRRRALQRDLRELRGEFSAAVTASPGLAAAVCVLAVVSGAPAWLPVLMADDISYHLGLGWELMNFAHARFDVGTQVWAMAPWSTDVLHALVMVLAGQETTGPLNTVWMLAAAWLVRSLAITVGLTPRLAWLAAAAYLSLPLTSMLTGSMQVESASPAWMAALAALLLARVEPGRAPLLLVAVLAGSLVGAKVSNGLLLLPFFFWWLLQWRGRLPWAELPQAILLGLVCAGSSYAYAAGLTGNPVLPLFNGWFESPWFATVNFADTNWTGKLGWDLPWRWVFSTHAFFETRSAGAAGVIVLALFGGLVGALADARTRALALATVGACMLMLLQIQYLRYLQPLMPMLVVVLVAGVATARPRGRDWVIGALVALQLALLPTGSWILMQRSLRVLVKEGPEAVALRTVPERLLAQRFREVAGRDDFVLFGHSGHAAIAELPGQSASSNWHSQYVWNLLRSGASWHAVFEATGANHVIARASGSEPGLAEALAERGAVALATVGAATLYQLPPLPAPVQAQANPDGSIQGWLLLDPEHPSVGYLGLQMGCDQPGQLVAIEWELERPNKSPVPHWDLLPCGLDGKLSIRMPYASLPHDGALHAKARPAPDATGLSLTLLGVEGDRRRDPAATSERYHAVWDSLCARPGCARDRTRLGGDRWSRRRD